MKHYYMVHKNFKTDRRFKILSIVDEDIDSHSIEKNRVDFNSFKFLNIEEDIHILACWLNFETCHTEFLIEHKNYPQVPIGAYAEIYDAKIVSYIRLIKVSNKL